MFLGGTRSGPMALTDEFALVAQVLERISFVFHRAGLLSISQTAQACSNPYLWFSLDIYDCNEPGHVVLQFVGIYKFSAFRETTFRLS